MRRRLFGRQGSSSSKAESTPASRHSRDGASPTPGSASPVKEKEKEKEKEKDKDASMRRQRSKKSMDSGAGSGKGGERLSIFGASFSGTLGKSRKPPPRYSTSCVRVSILGSEPFIYLLSSGSEETNSSERNSVFSMARLHSAGGRKSSSQRPVTPNPTTKNISSPKEVPEKEKLKSSPVASIREKEMRDSALLRKRTTSAPAIPSSHSKTNGNEAGMQLSDGKSILEQIGEPDHNGWMRKKGERYNSWKLRYFVLKGDHMYWLKSSHRTVRWFSLFLSMISANQNAGDKSQGIYQHCWL